MSSVEFVARAGRLPKPSWHSKSARLSTLGCSTTPCTLRLDSGGVSPGACTNATHLDVVGAQAAAAQHVVHAAGGADNDVHASTQNAGVLAHGGTTHTGMALDLWCREAGTVQAGQVSFVASGKRQCNMEPSK